MSNRDALVCLFRSMGGDRWRKKVFLRHAHDHGYLLPTTLESPPPSTHTVFHNRVGFLEPRCINLEVVRCDYRRGMA